MRYSTVLLLLVIPSWVTSGCSESQTRTRPITPYTVSHDPSRLQGRQPALLFDRVPGAWTAEDFAFRSDWPSTSKGQSAGEVIYYSTYVNDYQGGWGWWDGGGYYRNARYYRFGQIER